MVTLKSLSCFRKKTEHMKAVVHNLPSESYVDGLLGLNFLRSFKVYLDFRCGILSIE